jgi:hypothetical protein
MRLKAPAGLTSAGVGDVDYKPDADGFIDAAAHHVEAMLSHGFTVQETRAVQETRTEEKAEQPKRETLKIKAKA